MEEKGRIEEALLYVFSFGNIYHAVHVSLSRPVAFRPPP